MTYGYIPDRPKETDWMFGGLSGLTDRPILQADRDWTTFLPPFESQVGRYTDTMACVTFSALNCIEILMRRKYAETPDYSDRFTAKASGTSRSGNTFQNVGDSIRKYDGFILEAGWPKNPDMTWEVFYSAIPEEVRGAARMALEGHRIAYERVSPDAGTLWQALQYGPVQVALYAWPVPVDGVYPNTGKTANHAVSLVGGVEGQHFIVYDHYSPGELKKVAWDTAFGGAFIYDITPIEPTMNFIENTLYQLVEGSGGFYLMAAGKLRQDSLDKLLASWLVRNGGKTEGKVGTLLLKDLEGVTVYNLKGDAL